jgi:cytochrome b pre-mRNA-processing protein 3
MRPVARAVHAAAAAFQTGKTFWSTYVLLSLHVWMIIHRLRTCQHSDVRFFRQRFYNQFQQDVEFRVYAAGVQVRETWPGCCTGVAGRVI